MKLKLIFSLIAPLLLIVNCSNISYEAVITGKYESKKYNLIDNFFIQTSGKSYVNGSSVELKEDSTFLYNTCGNIIKGYWNIRYNDTLYLYCQEFKYKNDSLNKVLVTKCNSEPDKFYINPNGELQRQYVLKEQNLIILDYLVKVKADK
jgi:hypothetical protein